MAMRVNLRCPFQDKDQARQLGARWDPKLRVWYVDNTSDLVPFARWLPATASTSGAAEGTSTPGRTPTPGNGSAAVRRGSDGLVVTGPAVVADCGCTALPWEACDCAPGTATVTTGTRTMIGAVRG
jgi:hypothetical protein